MRACVFVGVGLHMCVRVGLYVCVCAWGRDPSMHVCVVTEVGSSLTVCVCVHEVHTADLLAEFAYVHTHSPVLFLATQVWY